MAVRAAQDGHVDHVGQVDVGDELRLTPQHLRVFDAKDPLTEDMSGHNDPPRRALVVI